MTQLTLSGELKVITEKILFHKEIAGRSIFEIGACLKQVRDNDLAHGQWEAWCSYHLSISARQARKYIRVYEKFSNRKLTSDSLERLDMLTSFDDEELDEPKTLPTGEKKTLMQMSSSEIEQYKRRAQEAERAAQQAKQEAERMQTQAHHYEKLWNSEKNKPAPAPQKVEVVPDHVKKKLDELEFQNRNLKTGYQEAKQKLQEYELRDTDEYNEEEMRRQREKLQSEADISTLNLRVAFKQFIEKAAITTYMQGAIAFADQSEKDRLAEMVESAQQIIDQTKLALRGRKLSVANE